MTSSKKGVRVIADTCRQKGIRKVVFSPGSRSAPLVIALSSFAEVECITIPDERVAGYFALGMAQQMEEPVALVCTSGTAVLNLAPAVCEAFYQNVPLLILTADRPEGAAGRGENQAIMQENIFGNHTLSKFSVNGDAVIKQELEEIAALISNAIDDTTIGYRGPVHVNVHMDEPLYETVNERLPLDIHMQEPAPENLFIPLKDLQRIKTVFENSATKMIIVGMHQRDDEVNEYLHRLSQRNDTIILYEHLSNLSIDNAVWNTDSVLALIRNGEVEDLLPQVVITMGGQILSKKIKQFLKNKPRVHWDIPPGSTPGRGWAAFGDMFDAIEPVNEKQFLKAILDTGEQEASQYRNTWLALSHKAAQLSELYFGGLPFSDLSVFKTLVAKFPEGANIQYGNSTPVRYGNFFRHNKSVTVNANRGTSGIDGCVSTATGAAYATNQITVTIVGDVSFFYDSNALWNNYLTPGLRIIVINNNGGNIFRLLDGPTTVNRFEEFFETRHKLTAKHLASMYGLPYYICASQNELDEALKTFFQSSALPKILEIKTGGAESAAVYKKYFEYLRNNK